MPPYVLRAELEGQEVLLNPETGVYHLVNEPVGSSSTVFETA